MRQLGEAGALLGVQEDVVDPHSHRGGDDGAGGGAGVVHVQAVHLGSQGEVQLDLVVLEGNQGQSQAGGLVEEKACIPSLSRYLCQPHRD